VDLVAGGDQGDQTGDLVRSDMAGGGFVEAGQALLGQNPGAGSGS
jgi:hypothetical protein